MGCLVSLYRAAGLPELERVHPLLAKYIRVDLEDYSLARL
jgi:hypothetical protein